NAVVITTGNSSNPPSISTNKTNLCGAEAATLTATGCTGTVTWSNSATGSSITVTNAGTYTAKCSSVSCGESNLSNQIVITTRSAPVAPIISANKVELCGTETTTLTSSGCAGTIKWNNGATNTSIVVNVSGTFTATCSNVCGESGNSNAIIIKKTALPPVPTLISNTTSLCGTEKANLIANGCSGQVTWSTGTTGTQLSVSIAGTYTATCSTVCGESAPSQSVVIQQGNSPAAPIISSDNMNVCGTEKATLIAMGCSGTITWSTGATGTTVQLSSGTYSAKCVNPCGISSASNVVNILKGGSPNVPKLTADKLSLCGVDTAILTARGCPGTIIWKSGATGSTLTVSAAGTYTATCKNDCGTSLSSDNLVILSGGNPSAPNVSANKTEICTTESAVLTATGCSGIVTWNNATSGSSLTVSTVGTYTAICTNTCGTSAASKSIVIKAKLDCDVCTTPNAPTIVADKTSLCGTETATLTASNCSGTITWSSGATSTTIIVGVAGTYTATCTNNCGTSPVSRVLTITSGGAPSAPNVTASNTSLCGTETATLNATGCSGTITWSAGATGSSFAVSTAGTFTATCKNACGTSVASQEVVITTGQNPAAPAVTSSKTEICATESAILSATPCTGTITWSNGATGSSLTVTTSGTYTATCKNACGTSVASIPIIIKSKTDCGTGCLATAPVASASQTTICKPENVTLTATGCITGTVVWSTGQTGNVVTVKPTATSTYSAVCNVSSTCSSPLSNLVQVKVGVVSTPTVACSTDLVCSGESATLKAYGCEGTVVWSNGSTGESVIVIPDGITKYSAKCKVGDCESLVSEHIAIAVGIPNKPFITCKNNVICSGGSTTLTATGCTGIVVWSEGSTGGVLNVSPTAEKTTYTAICKSLGGKCESEKSNEVVVTVGKKVDAPKLIAEIKNVCPFNTADLNTAILSDPAAGGQFEFHTTSSTNSPLVTNPGAVVAGTYYIFERSTVGCYSDGVAVKVTITACEGGGVTPTIPVVDIAVKKVASAPVVPVNETVSYKVIVKNNGQVKATGIEVRDILPSGLAFESVTSNATFANGIVSLKLDSLVRGDSVIFTYNTKVTAAGKIVNKAELSKIKETDNVLSNNSSEAVINDPASGELIGLSKVCDPAILVSDKIYNVPFVIYVTNLGGTDVKNIQVKDDLDRAFGNGAKILNDTIKIVADSGLVVNPKYTGRGLNTDMLIDSLSSIKKGQKLVMRFTVKVDLKNATVTDFFNVAEVTANGKKDISTDGINSDPDGDGDPTNNADPTPIQFKIDIAPDRPAIGIALSVADSAKVDETCYSVTYLALVKNFGNSKLTNVQVSDTLSKTFADSVTYRVLGSSVSKNSTLKLNPNFNGKEDVNLLIADSTSKLEVGQLDSLVFTVKVFHKGVTGPFNNNAYAKAIGNGKVVTDISNAGTEIKINESTPTALVLPVSEGNLTIPEAFSPNGDGKNDTFIIELPAGATMISCDIYNRWGHVVFKDKDGILTNKTKGWDGTSNQGVRFGTEGVPDGTYFFTLDYELNGQRVHKVSYLTLAR
uniref:T9SS type B sorting domain-containing protein n=1 Tax=Emticicia sp. TaxID=1930953 RepID=UPI003BA568FB